MFVAVGSHRPMARDSATTSATCEGSRPNRAASFCTSDLGVPTPARTSANAPDWVRPSGLRADDSRAATATLIARGAGSSEKRARRGRVVARGDEDLAPLPAARRARCGAPLR